jgi:DNA replication protein DnaC
MLQQPMKEKLYALKLQGMIEALEHQEQDEAARELSFLDRLALLIDQQWNWRQNQALTRRVIASRLRGTACVENIDYRAERGLNRSVIRGLAQESTWVANHEHILLRDRHAGVIFVRILWLDVVELLGNFKRHILKVRIHADVSYLVA